MMRDLPPLNALRAFEATALLGSVSQAAEQLHVTHGAVSRQLKLLEEDLGVTLFVKDGRGLKLTDEGVRLRDASAEAFDRLREVCQSLTRQRTEAPFVLGCSGSLLARWFIPRLGRLDKELPGLRLQMSAVEGEPDSRRPGLDAWLVWAEPPWPADMEVHELAVEHIGPVLSPRYGRFDQLQGASPQALQDEPLLHTASRPQAWPNWTQSHGLSDLQFGQGFEHLYYLLEAAVAGLGVAIAPQLLVADDLRDGRLVAPWGFTATSARLALLLPQRTADGRGRQLARWLEAEIARLG